MELQHFLHYFDIEIAHSPTQRDDAFRLRHKVYCEFLKWETEQENKLEFDTFDTYATICLIKVRSTGETVATTRVVFPSKPFHTLPFSRFFSAHSMVDTLSACEISRFAICPFFRTRSLLTAEGEQIPAQSTLLVALYLCASTIVAYSGRRHVYMMMEKRLAKALSKVNMTFDHIDTVLLKEKERQLYCAQITTLVDGFPEAFMSSLQALHRHFETMNTHVNLLEETHERKVSLTA